MSPSALSAVSTTHFSVLVVALILVCSLGCNNSPGRSGKEGAEKSHKVIAVSYALQFLTQQLLNEVLIVEMPDYGDTQPRDWRPEAEFIRHLQKADLIVANGSAARAAPWLNVVSIAESKVVPTGENIHLTDFILIEDAPTHSHGPEGEHSHSGIVATTWLNPRVAKDQAAMIADRLCELYPEHRKDIRANQKQLDQQLDDLTKRIEALTEFSGSKVLASEPSFKYLLRPLGIEDKHYFWTQEQSAITETLWDEFDQTRPAEATFMLWPYPPPQEIADRLNKRSINVVVIDLLTIQPKSGDYIQVMKSNIDKLEKALTN